MYLKIPFEEYDPWGGAVETYEKIEENGKLDALKQYIQYIFFEHIPTMTEVNDLLWFDSETVLCDLGIRC